MTTRGSGADGPVVPGVRPVALLGRGRYGEVWSAEATGTGEPVVLRLGPRDRGPLDEREALRQARLVAALRRADPDHVVRLRRVVDLPAGRRALVLDLAQGGSLLALLRRYGPLPAAQTLTVAVGVARGLAGLHAAGLAHGGPGAADVLLTRHGRPLLDVAPAALLVPGDAPTGTSGPQEPGRPTPGPRPVPADDVLALGRLVTLLLGDLRADGADPAPDRLLEVAGRCVDPDPAARPTAARAVELLAAAGPARPLPAPVTTGRARGEARPADCRDARPGAGPGPRPGPRVEVLRLAASGPRPATARNGPAGAPDARAGVGARRPGPRAIPVAAVTVSAVVLVTMVAVAGWARGAGSPDPGPAASTPAPPAASVGAGPATPAPGQAPPEEDMTEVVRRLAERRAQAFREADASRLVAVHEPGSPALAADTALVRRLVDRGLRLDRLTYVVRSVSVTARRGDEVSVRVLVGTSAHRQTAVAPVRAGTSTSAPSLAPSPVPVPAQDPRDVELRLVRTDRHGWLVRDVSG